MDFKAPYNRNEYIDFFRRQLLPEDFQDHSEDIAVGFKSHLITKVVKIGEVPSLELLICEVSHPSENDPRVSLSRDAFRLLAHYGAKRALIIFNSENSQNFRLSLVTIDLKWEEGKRVQKEYSNPRRYSFFLGPETRIHTPEQYLIKQGRIKDFDDLKGRFSIEVVNKDFYTQIAVLFTQLAGGKRTIGRKAIDAGRGLLNLPSTVDDTLDKEFTVRLIGRLVFCWFLKKKRSDKNIPLLPEELLSAKAVSENKGYYHGILEPLFFEVLNTPADNRVKKYQSSPWSQIPFLNGGLFTPHLHDYYDPGPLGISKHINTLKVPDHWIKELFEVFETYNFTIDENTSVDVELSIEPEMLGRIFENLLAEINPETGETARKATGSYYTPRPIVEYMVDESLKQYLLTKTKLDEDTITRLLTYEDVEIKLTASEKESVLNALDTIKIIDPACGSGAFPMGILQKMLLILQKVDPDSEWWLDTKLSQIESKLLKKELGKKLKAENVNYVHKLGIIQSSIYGVDIQPIAVEISKLRFFLSLIVDENVDDSKENRGIEPLPNLEFKFVCANSLIGLPKKEPQQTLFEAVDDIKALRDLRDDYLRSYGQEKQKIEKKFQEVQSRMFKHSIGWGGKDSQTLKLAQWNPFSEDPCSWFDPDWMFGIKGGFDIVIANPPYLESRNPLFSNNFKDTLQLEVHKRWGAGGDLINRSADLLIYFFETSLKLISVDGLVIFITQNAWLDTEYGRDFQEFLIHRTNVIAVIDSDYKYFDSTSGSNINTVISIFKGLLIPVTLTTHSV
jgi:adenine-specific DNA-methyltransferase